jgi:thioesterase domain-containing protein
LNRDELLGIDRDDRLRRVYERVQKTGFVSAAIDFDYVRRFVRICQANLQAVANYDPQPAELPVVLFRAADSAGRSGEVAANGLADLGWRLLTGDQLQIVEVPGNHVTMLTGEQARHLGMLLRDQIKATGTDRLAELRK